MPHSESTCWTMIRAAAAGDPAEREELARRYLGVVRAYLAARWRGSALRDELDDATQAVFVECFRQGGVLDAAGHGRVPGFRAFLYGVIRNVARALREPARRDPRARCRTSRRTTPSQSRLFDRTWAQAIMAEAGRLQRARAEERGPEAVHRVELLRLRFEENLPIRDDRPPLGHRPGDRSTSPMPLPGRSFGRPCWRSWRSTIRAARSSWKRKRRAS